MSNLRPATANDVRNFFAQNPDMIPVGHEKIIGVGTRGRISVEVADAFRLASGSKREYVEGFKRTPTVKVGRKSVEARTVRAALIAAGHEIGKRGTLTDAHIAAYAAL